MFNDVKICAENGVAHVCADSMYCVESIVYNNECLDILINTGNFIVRKSITAILYWIHFQVDQVESDYIFR